MPYYRVEAQFFIDKYWAAAPIACVFLKIVSFGGSQIAFEFGPFWKLGGSYRRNHPVLDLLLMQRIICTSVTMGKGTAGGGGVGGGYRDDGRSVGSNPALRHYHHAQRHYRRFCRSKWNQVIGTERTEPCTPETHAFSHSRSSLFLA